LAVMLPAALFAQNRPRLAILPFTGSNAEDAESIAEFFSFEPELNRNFIPVPRTRAVENLMKEQQFQRSGLTDADTIAELGKQMGADYVVAGHITSLGTGQNRSNLLLITIIHVERLQQIAGDYREYKRIEETEAFLPDMARRVTAAARQDTSRLSRLAVLPFNVLSSGINQGDAEVLAQILATDIANSGKYAVFPRTRAIERVMTEHKIQRDGMTDPESIKLIGAAVNARFVLSANVRSLGANKYFSASILHIEGGGQEQGTRKQYQNVSDGLSLMAELAGELTGVVRPAGGTVAGTAPANFVRVEGGTFQMGSASGGEDRERPVRSVTVKSFNIGKYEVTQKEWFEVMGSNPSSYKGDNLPVEQVSWLDVIEYCNRRSVKEGLTPMYSGYGNSISCNWSANGYRLPTEAEWEYAAKGGNKDPMVYEYSGSNSVDTVAWYGSNSGSRTQPVGTKAANSLGIHDMSGNVWEWCWDWYGTYPSGAQSDPTGASSGSDRMRRGGSSFSSAAGTRSANRSYDTPTNRDYGLGFRLVRNAQ